MNGEHSNIPASVSTDLVAHTPGPWSNERIWDTPASRIHARVEGVPMALAEVFTMRNAGEKEANARLIAAAPDLLALAKQYASECAMCGGTNRDPWNDPKGKPCADCADIRAVIAKAEGRSHG